MNKRTSLFALLLTIVIVIPTFGQIKQAQKQMDLFNYSEAVSILQKAIHSDSRTTKEATVMIAECYRKMNDMQNAKAWYGRAVKGGNTDPMNYYYYAQALRSTGDYQKAKSMFRRYDSISPSDPQGKIYAAFCDSAMAWKSNPPAFEVKNATALNSPQSDFGPAFYDNGIIYASDRTISSLDNKKYGWTGNSYLHMFCSDPVYPDEYYDEFKAPTLAPGTLNKEYHDGPATFNADFTEIYFNRTFVTNDKGKKENKIRTHLLKIFYASKKNGNWGKPKPFFLNSNDYSVGHPALSPEADTLYFVSDKEGGSGGTDIYYCVREGDKWSDATNLGDVINTFGNEMFPFIAANGDLYFASTGHAGFGGLDIFVSKMVDGKWTAPKNLGLPLNSSYDDFSLAEYKDTEKGLFCSNRPNGKGTDDIYSFKRIIPDKPKKPEEPAQPLAYVSGCVKDKTTLEPIPGATVFLLDNETGKVLVMKANANGCFKTAVKKGDHYLVKGMKNNYIADCLPFTFDPTEPKSDLNIPRDLLLDKLALNKKFKLENIYYDFDKYYIRKDAEPPLNALVKIMQENPITVELGSHTDCRGTYAYNVWLSQHRAESAVNYIVATGIDRSRITAHGYGETQLVNKCSDGVFCSEPDHQLNRRTEFKVTSTTEEKVIGTFNPDRFREGELIDIRFMPDGFFYNCEPAPATAKN